MILLRALKQRSLTKVGIAVPILRNMSGAGEGAARMGMTVLSEKEVLWAQFRAALTRF